jgi:putative pyruvate formate lyase activating enzyme
MPRLTASEIEDRARALRELERPCRLCPRQCRAERDRKPGTCLQPERAMLALACAHRGEEPALAGESGAGTIFVAGCGLRCRFCQNHQISQAPPRAEWARSEEQLCEEYLELTRQGCVNLEWVSPTQHLPALVGALARARAAGLDLPVVYNTNGYDRVEVLRLLDGIVDVYLPDAKYAQETLGRELSGAADYVTVNRAALVEMWRQVGALQLDERGLARRGLIVRHLVLPGELADTRQILQWLARELSPQVCVSLMAQYHPAHELAGASGPLGRPLTRREYDRAVDALLAAGLEEGWVQERSSCARFLPDFDLPDPFASDRGAR